MILLVKTLKVKLEIMSGIECCQEQLVKLPFKLFAKSHTPRSFLLMRLLFR